MIYDIAGRIYKKNSTKNPSAILYHPKAEKLCFFTKFIKNLIVTAETANAVNVPAIRMANSADVTENPFNMNFRSLSRLAPNIAGSARKNENSDAVLRFIPRIIPPSIVEPERDVPGTMESV